MTRRTRSEQIEHMLRTAGPYGVCGATFLENYIPTYSQRIGELKRNKGLTIRSEPCKVHAHEGSIARYFLVDEGQLI